MQAVLYHHGAPARSGLLTAEARAWLAGLPLPVAAREQITVALAMIDAHDAQLAPLDRELRNYARRQAGCRALMCHYGIGPLTAVTILAELGDARRFSSSREAVRYAGLDITVHQSDARRAPGRLSRQGPSALRWALFEAAQCARRPGSPDHDYYTETAARLGGNRACLGMAFALHEMKVVLGTLFSQVSLARPAVRPGHVVPGGRAGPDGGRRSAGPPGTAEIAN